MQSTFFCATHLIEMRQWVQHRALATVPSAGMTRMPRSQICGCRWRLRVRLSHQMGVRRRRMSSLGTTHDSLADLTFL